MCFVSQTDMLSHLKKIIKNSGKMEKCYGVGKLNTADFTGLQQVLMQLWLPRVQYFALSNSCPLRHIHSNSPVAHFSVKLWPTFCWWADTTFSIQYLPELSHGILTAKPCSLSDGYMKTNILEDDQAQSLTQRSSRTSSTVPVHRLQADLSAVC